MVAAPLRIVFFGTPAFAVPTLDALLASPHSVVAVVTQPDRPRGRGHKIEDAPVKAHALAASIPVLQPDRLKDPQFVAALRGLGADVGVVAAYGRILTDDVLAAPRLGMLNVHASLLPKYRGAAPVHRAVMAGESRTGVTIMRVVKALDAGPMLAAAPRPIASDETSDAVERDLARLGAALLVASLDAVAAGRAVETPQDESAATYAPRLTKDDAIVDWSRPAVAIHDQIRGLHPWPHAASVVRGRRLILLRSSPTAAAAPSPGAVLEAHGDRLIVGTGAGALALLQVQPEGKRPMNAREFLAGRPLSVGDRFGPA
jgi:methionyl-tRNA formyltransferase